MRLTKIKATIMSLCTPAFVYFVISAIAFVTMVIQNLGNTDRFCFGKQTCDIPSTLMMFAGQALWIAGWTYLLSYLCRKGHKGWAWALLVLPFILMFVFIGLIVSAVVGGVLKFKGTVGV
jgi:hypothetical protein